MMSRLGKPWPATNYLCSVREARTGGQPREVMALQLYLFECDENTGWSNVAAAIGCLVKVLVGSA